MRLAGSTTAVLRLPLDQPLLGTPLGPIDHLCCLTLQLQSHDGPIGIGLFSLYNDRAIRQLAAMQLLVNDLCELIRGRVLDDLTAVHDALRAAIAELLHEGMAVAAAAVVDMALWDMAARAAGKPLSRFIGARRSEVPVYASHALQRDEPEALAEDAAELRDSGFRAAKLSVGSRPLPREVRRISAVRQALGPEYTILIDCGRRFTAAEAIHLADAIRDLDVYWMEDPVAQADLAGLRRVRDKCSIPIATGERLSTMGELRRLLELQCLDHLTLDLQRIGGVTSWLAAAGLASAELIPLSGHGSHEYQAHLVATQPRAGFLEYHPYCERLYVEPPLIRDGAVQLLERPGFGLEFDRAALAAYQAA
jgi:mandelate racemase